MQALVERLEGAAHGATGPPGQQHMQSDVARGAQALDQYPQGAAHGQVVVIDHQHVVRPFPTRPGHLTRCALLGRHPLGQQEVQLHGQVLGSGPGRDVLLDMGVVGQVHQGAHRIQHVQADFLSRVPMAEVPSRPAQDGGTSRA